MEVSAWVWARVYGTETHKTLDTHIHFLPPESISPFGRLVEHRSPSFVLDIPLSTTNTHNTHAAHTKQSKCPRYHRPRLRPEKWTGMWIRSCSTPARCTTTRSVSGQSSRSWPQRTRVARTPSPAARRCPRVVNRWGSKARNGLDHSAPRPEEWLRVYR